ATFLAEPRESVSEIGELYESGAIWRDIIQNLSGGRIESEVRSREVMDSFAVKAAPGMEDFSLYTVRPYFHAKIYTSPDGVALDSEPDFPDGLQIIYKGISDPHGAAVYITREAVRSRWSSDERFANIEYDIFIFHHNSATRLLFVCASRRQDKLYTRLARNLVGGRPRQLSQSRISRALNDLEGAEFFSVGMRKRHKFGRIESYRMIAGPNADRAIQESDGRLFDRGHCFGKGIDDGEEVTLGVSTSSKVWSNAYDQIPELLQWCDRLAEKIASDQTPVTGSGLDFLSAGEDLDIVPEGVIALNWAFDTYRNTPIAFYLEADGTMVEAQLLDFDLDVVDSRPGAATFAIRRGNLEWIGVFSLDREELISPASSGEPALVVHLAGEDIPIAEYLNEELPTFFTKDLSSIDGYSIYPARTDLEPFGDDDFRVVDWTGVDIKKEKPDGALPKSIFEWLQAELIESAATVVFCDDGAGEIADFVVLTEDGERTRVAFYHCKASEQSAPGNRVDDLYEVCGQAVKSGAWMTPVRLREQIEHRATLPSVRGFMKGTMADLSRLLAKDGQRGSQFEVFIVQPGVKSVGRGPNMSTLLAATRHYLVHGAVDRFEVIGS